MPVDLNSLKEGWLELESDPGLFTLLLEDFGVRGVQVEEIYDLQKPIEGPVYGFIFLFKWIEERRSRRKVSTPDESFIQDEEIVNSIFFAHQIVPNSCATHALLSVLLNCSKIHLGDTLARLKEYTKNMSPENKGYAIGNTPELAKAHNSHAKPEPRRLHEKTHGITTGRTVEAFHFVSYVPIAGQLFELDGLKPYPINHGPWESHEDWTEKFRRVITERLGIATGDEPYHDIRFNLMAVVPDRRIAYEHKLQTLKTNRQIVLEALQQLVKMTIPELTSDDQAEYMAAVIRSKEQNNSLAFAEKPKSRTEANASDAVTNTTDASGSDYTSDEDNENKAANEIVSSSSSRVSDRTLAMPIHVNTKDYSHPLSIQTKFEASPTPSNSSTDTSSEVGSAFNSPVRTLAVGSTQSSPTFTMSRDIKKFVVIRMSSDKEGSSDDRTSQPVTNESCRSLRAPPSTPPGTVCRSGDNDIPTEGKHYDLKRQISSKLIDVEPLVKRSCSVTSVSDNITSKTGLSVNSATGEAEGVSDVPRLSSAKHDGCEAKRWEDNKRDVSRYPKLIEPHSFAPKDLLALLKNVENEIAVCETNLHEEIEKRKKYKVDDCRRTHNYDLFVCTFAKMLAQQGMLADLVRHNVLVKSRQGINIGRLHKKADRRRRARPKKRK